MQKILRNKRLFFILCLCLILVFVNYNIIMAMEDFDGYIFKEKGDDVSEIQTADSLTDIYKKADAEDLEYIEPNYIIYLTDYSETPNDVFFSNQKWIFNMLNIQNVWKENFYGGNEKAATVAVIDTGVSKHPDLDNILPGVRYKNGEKVGYTGDIDFHGTFVAGIISATNNNGIGITGAMPDTKIYPINVFRRNNKGKIYSLTSDLVSGINDAIEHNVDVINLSVGSEGISKVEKEVINKALNKKIIIVAAAGNNGNTTRFYPASLDNVVSVVSVDVDGNRSSFSNHNKKIIVSAPGESIVSTAPTDYSKNGMVSAGYMKGSGTSFSTPYVSALAAMYKSLKPGGNATDFINLLKKTSTDKGKTGYDEYYGWGIVNFEKVYKKIIEGNVPLPKINIVSLKRSGRTIYVRWSKPKEEENSLIDGYQLRYSTKKSFSSYNTIKIKNPETLKRTVKNLKKDKKYYFKIRTYKGSKYSEWSKVKSIKIK